MLSIEINFSEGFKPGLGTEITLAILVDDLWREFDSSVDSP